jgi:hypothetical protein
MAYGTDMDTETEYVNALLMMTMVLMIVYLVYSVIEVIFVIYNCVKKKKEQNRKCRPFAKQIGKYRK